MFLVAGFSREDNNALHLTVTRGASHRVHQQESLVVRHKIL